MDRKDKLYLPDEVLQDMKLEDVFFPINSDKTGVVVLSQKEEDNDYLMRIFQLVLDSTLDQYFPIQELVAFKFPSYYKLKDFLITLPTLNGIEMLMLLNPLPPTDNVNVDELSNQMLN